MLIALNILHTPNCFFLKLFRHGNNFKKWQTAGFMIQHQSHLDVFEIKATSSFYEFYFSILKKYIRKTQTALK